MDWTIDPLILINAIVFFAALAIHLLQPEAICDKLSALPPLIIRGRSMASKPPRILIAEDSDENRIALMLMLQLVGYAPIEARDGAQALAATRRLRPDLILMDISLPGIDGLEATRALRAEEDFRALPIIVISAHDDQASRDAARHAGANDFLSKPIEFEEIRKLIERHLGPP